MKEKLLQFHKHPKFLAILIMFLIGWTAIMLMRIFGVPIPSFFSKINEFIFSPFFLIPGIFIGLSVWYLVVFFRRRKTENRMPFYPVIFLDSPIFGLILFLLLFEPVSWIVDLFPVIDTDKGYVVWVVMLIIVMALIPIFSSILSILNFKKRHFFPASILLLSAVINFILLFTFVSAGMMTEFFHAAFTVFTSPPKYEVMDSKMMQFALRHSDSPVLNNYIEERARVYKRAMQYSEIYMYSQTHPRVEYYSDGMWGFYTNTCTDKIDEARKLILAPFGDQEDAKLVKEEITEQYFEFFITAIDTRFNYKPRENHIWRVHRCGYINFRSSNDISLDASIVLNETTKTYDMIASSSTIGYFLKKNYETKDAEVLFLYLVQNAFGFTPNIPFSNLLTANELTETGNGYDFRFVDYELSRGIITVQTYIFSLDRLTGEIKYSNSGLKNIIAQNDEKKINRMGKACQLAIKQKILPDVQFCNEKKYMIEEGKEVSYVSVTYGPPQDCMSGCIYNNYTGILDENGIHDFNSPPNLYHLIENKYGQQCARFNYYDDSPSLRKSVILKDGKYYWVYNFSQFDVEKNSGEYKDYYQKQHYSNTCVLNGKLVITKIEGYYAKEADFSRMKFYLKNR